MADKLSINSKFDDLFYEPSDSEEEYTKKERELLKNVRSRTKKKDKEVEIFKFSSSDDDDDYDGNDVEDDEEQDVLDNSDLEDDRRADDDIPDSKAWGNKRSLYYHTDFVDQDYSTYNEKDEELALQEEQEAKAIQQRLAQQLDDIDFSLDVYADPDQDQLITENDDISTADAAKEDIDHEIKLKRDLENLSERQKLQLFKKDSPEFFGLIQDFEKYFQESQTVLQPFLECIKNYDVQSPTIQFVETLNNLILTYCTNITFYLTLKSKRLSIKNHPVIKRLVQTRQILQQLEQKYDNVVKNEILKVIEMIEGGCNIVFVPPSMENVIGEKKNRKTKVSKKKIAGATTLEDEDELDDDKDEEIVENSVDEDEEGEEGDERRGITYQIKKNKGLTPYRRKDLKNPRVKHRNKYRKALIRRKGAVRTVRKELKRYGGEISGIKATVKKSIKLKS